MNINIRNLIINNSFEQLNTLIKLGVIDIDDVLKTFYYLKEGWLISFFASQVKDAPIDKLAEVIILIKDPRYIYKFACDIEGAPVGKLAKAIIETKDAKYIYLFARDVKGASIDELADAVIETKNAKYIYLFACDIGAPINKLANAILATRKAAEINDFALLMQSKGLINEKLMLKFAETLMDIKEASKIYLFALNIKGAPVDELAEAEIACQDEEFISLFARDIEGSPIDKLGRAILKGNKARFISFFVLNVDNIPLDLLKELVLALLATNACEYISDFILRMKENLKANLLKAFSPKDIVKELYQKLVSYKNVSSVYALVNHLSPNDTTTKEDIKQWILDTNDALFIYECRASLDKNFLSEFINKIVELKDFKVISNLLLDANFIELGEGRKLTSNTCLLNNIPFLLDAMQECEDIYIIRYTFAKSNLPVVTSYLGKLIQVREQKQAKEDMHDLSSEDKMRILTELYNKKDFETIRKYREVFSTLFQDKKEEITRGM